MDTGQHSTPQDLFHLAVEAAPIAVLAVNASGEILLANRAAQAMFGYGPDELTGQLIEIIVPRRFHDEHPAYRDGFLAAPEARPMGAGRDLYAVHRDGHEFPVEVGLNPVHTSDGIVVLASVADITARKEAEGELRASEERYRRLVETAGCVILSLSPDYRILDWNREAERLYGYDREEVLGKSYVERFLPAEAREAVKAEIEHLMSGGRTEGFENPVLCRDGSQRTMLWNATRLVGAGNTVIGLVAVGQDITERNQLVKELMEKDALARLGEMAAVMAHEIKNPLAGISGAIQIIERDLDRDGSFTPVIQEIGTSIQRLTKSVDDLLLFARPQSPQLRPTSIRSLLEGTAALFLQDPALKVDLEVVGKDMIVACDQEMMKPVILNMLMNAAEAMNKTGRIEVSVEARSDRCLICIRDDGPGIPPDVRKRIFEPFFTTKTRGTGLGLPISRRTIEAHGGSVEITTGEPGGTTVTIQIPRAG